MKKFIFCLLFLAGVSISLAQSENVKKRDSITYQFYNKLPEFVRIKYVGDQDHPMPVIYIGRDQESDSIKYLNKYSASRTMYFFVTYEYSFQNSSYQTFKKWIIKYLNEETNANNNHYTGAFEICIKLNDHVDTMYAHSLHFLEYLRRQINTFSSGDFPSFVWLAPAIDELEKYSKPYFSN